MKITYDELTSKQQTISTIRTVCTVIGWIITVAGLIFGIVFAIKDGESEGADFAERISFILQCVAFGGIFGGFPVGLAHAQMLFHNIKGVFYIPIIGWALWIAIIVCVPYFTGWFHMIVDTVRIIIKRPLISEKEYFSID